MNIIYKCSGKRSSNITIEGGQVKVNNRCYPISVNVIVTINYNNTKRITLKDASDYQTYNDKGVI